MENTKVFTNRQEWYDEKGRLHRDNDLPAIVEDSGAMLWYKHGILHRDNDLPAIIERNGTSKWYENGILVEKNKIFEYK